MAQRTPSTAASIAAAVSLWPIIALCLALKIILAAGIVLEAAPRFAMVVRLRAVIAAQDAVMIEAAQDGSTMLMPEFVDERERLTLVSGRVIE